MRRLLIWFAAISWIIGSLLALLYYGDPVIISIGEDPGDPIPCILNPLRDRGPEIVAYRYMALLKNGNPEKVEPFVDAGNMIIFKENENKYRIVSWRIADRKDDSSKCKIIFWARRLSVRSEQEVEMYLEKQGTWRIKGYAAVY